MHDVYNKWLKTHNPVSREILSSSIVERVEPRWEGRQPSLDAQCAIIMVNNSPTMHASTGQKHQTIHYEITHSGFYMQIEP